MKINLVIVINYTKLYLTVVVPSRGNSTRSSLTRLRPGSLNPGGKGVDIKHNSYNRYLARIKAKNLGTTFTTSQGVRTNPNLPLNLSGLSSSVKANGSNYSSVIDNPNTKIYSQGSYGIRGKFGGFCLWSGPSCNLPSLP